MDKKDKKQKTIITFGSYDLLHLGHINLIKRAKELGDKLIVGVSSDSFHHTKKNRPAIYNEHERMEIINSLKYVDKVFLEEDFAKKREYCKKYKADILVMGDDWLGHFDDLKDICEVIYLPRTENLSTSQWVDIIKRTA